MNKRSTTLEVTLCDCGCGGHHLTYRAKRYWVYPYTGTHPKKRLSLYSLHSRGGELIGDYSWIETVRSVIRKIEDKKLLKKLEEQSPDEWVNRSFRWHP